MMMIDSSLFPVPYVWNHHFIEANQVRLHYVEAGAGEPVILLHGFPEFWYSWRYQIPVLAKYFRVIVPDLRGYNDSDKPLTGYDLETVTNDIRCLIENLGYPSAHVVGHDIGGAIAWNLAQKFPQSIKRLGILNAPHPQKFMRSLVSNFDQARRSWYMLAFQVPLLPEWVIQMNLREFVVNGLRDQAVRKGIFTREHAQMYETALQKPGAIGAALNYYRQMFTPGAWMQNLLRPANLIQSPTLVLWSEEDAFLSRQLVQGLEQLVAAPFALKLVPDCGHWMQQEAPQMVNRELLDFLRRPGI
jgi:epoxide hydrolase 4